MIPALDQYEKGENRGIKVAFMQRKRSKLNLLLQSWPNEMRETAAHFACDFPPRRTARPSLHAHLAELISNEGVRGMEMSK